MIRLIAVIKKEFIQMSRDKATLAIMIIMPLMQVLIFGFAINTDVKHLSAAVFDQSLSAESRELLDTLTATEYYNIKYIATSFEEITKKIQSGKAKVGIVIPPDYAANLKNNKGSEVQIIVDASDNLSASSAISTAEMVGQRKSQEILLKQINSKGTSHLFKQNAVNIKIRPWYNPDFITAFYTVPGICATILTLTMLLVTSLAIIKERENGTLEQLIVTPLKSSELMLGKIIPYILVGYVQLTILLLTAKIIFNVPFLGNIFLLYALTGLFIIASLSFGLFISNLAKSQMQGMMMSFSIILPSIMLSGFVFPREAMPTFFYYLGYLLPITFYLEIIRGIVLKGSGFIELLIPVCALLFFIFAILSISIIKFKKRLD